MPDEPAPVAELVVPSRRTLAETPRSKDKTAMAGGQGALAPEALASQEAQRRELLEAIRTPIITTSLAGRVTGFNAAAIALFGSPSRLYGRNIRVVMPFVPEPSASGAGDAQGRFADATGRTVDLQASR